MSIFTGVRGLTRVLAALSQDATRSL